MEKEQEQDTGFDANKVRKTAVGVSIVAILASVMNVSLYWGIFGVSEKQSDVNASISRQIDLWQAQQIRLGTQVDKFAAILPNYLESDDAEIGLAILSSELELQEKRIEAFEELLNTAPREIIEIVRLNDKLEQQIQNNLLQKEQTERELDRIYVIFFSTIATLIVAIIGLIIVNIPFKRK